MPNAAQADRPSDKTILAAGLFARLADAIDRGRFIEANRARNRLATLGFAVTFRRHRKPHRPEGGGR